MSKMKLLLDFITALSGLTPTLTGMAVTPGWRLICSWWHLEARLFHGAGSIWLTRLKHEVNILQLFVLPISTILNRYLSSSELEEMVGRVGFEPTTNGLKVLIGEYNGLFINVLPWRPMRLLQHRA